MMSNSRNDVFAFDGAAPGLSDAALEAWLRESGLEATVVRRCPKPACVVCDRLELGRAA